MNFYTGRSRSSKVHRAIYSFIHYLLFHIYFQLKNKCFLKQWACLRLQNGSPQLGFESTASGFMTNCSWITRSESHHKCVQQFWAWQYLAGILPKGSYLPCVSMAGRALLAGYHPPVQCNDPHCIVQVFKYSTGNPGVWLDIGYIAACNATCMSTTLSACIKLLIAMHRTNTIISRSSV